MEKRDDTTPQVRSRALMQESAAAIPPLTQVCGVEPLCRKRKRCRQRSNFRSPASQAMALLLELSGSAQPCLRGRGGPFGFNPQQLRRRESPPHRQYALFVDQAGGPRCSGNLFVHRTHAAELTFESVHRPFQSHQYSRVSDIFGIQYHSTYVAQLLGSLPLFPISSFGGACARAASATQRLGRVVFCRRWLFPVAPTLPTRTFALVLLPFFVFVEHAA